MNDTEKIKNHLQQYAQLNHFWILRTTDIQPGLIHYLGTDGVAYALMDDNDDRVEQCIEFLESNGCPVFADPKEMDNYSSQLGNISA